MSETVSHHREIDWAKVMETALTMPGDVGNIYNRFHTYSKHNQVHFWEQGIREPVAKMKLWNALGRMVIPGSKAYEVYVPIFAKKDKNDPDAEPVYLRSIPVRRVFTYSQTAGTELPPVEIPEWDTELALATLGVARVQFRRNDANLQGYAKGKEIAINPFAVHPNKTLMHELGHVVLGHTTPEMIEQYEQHRGIFEFQAEATAHLTMNELSQLTDEMATHSRGYIQGWLKGERPPDKAIHEVFTATDRILKAGRIAVGEVVSGESSE
jgi:hypothetical protein